MAEWQKSPYMRWPRDPSEYGVQKEIASGAMRLKGSNGGQVFPENPFPGASTHRFAQLLSRT